MKTFARILALALLASALSCSKGDMAAKYEMAMATDEAVTEQSTQVPVDEGAVVHERMIIKQGRITFQTGNAAKTRSAVTEAVSKAGGYVSSDNISEYSGRTHHNLTVRVPADKFDYLLAKIESSAGKIDDRWINAADVTSEFIDVEARLAAKKELEKRYLQLLRNAWKIEDILAIERETTNLRSEIESAEGRLKYLSDQVSYSTLDVTFYEQGPTAFGFGPKFTGGIKAGWDNFLWFVIGVVNVWPFILGAIVLIWFLSRIRRRHRRREFR